MVIALNTHNIFTYYHGFLLVAIGWLERESLAVLILAEHVFRYLSLIVLDETVGCLHNQLGGTVILLQFKLSCIGV